MKTPRSLALLLAIVLAAALGATDVLAQETPRRGGIVTWFDYGDPVRLDTHGESALVTQQAVAGVFSGLLHYDPADPSKVVGDLAEKWDVSADGTTYTFHLRRGVKWHDGQPFSAADVKASFDRILDPKFKSPKCGAALKPMVASVEVLDANTVQFRLKFAAAPFVSALGSAWCRVAAKHVLEKYPDLNRLEAQIGTGPFKFKRYERGNLIEWERNPDYFLKGLPYVDGVKQYVLVGGPTQLAAAKAGKVMLWDTWPPMKKTQADELRNARGDAVQVSQVSINTIFVVYLNTKRPPFDNPDLRRAVFLGIDRQEMVGKALEGAGVPCALLDPKLVGDFALPLDEVKKMPGCRQPKDADIAEAKRLVEKSHPGGLDVEVAVRSVGNYLDRAQVLLAQLQKIGIRGRLKSYESAAGFAVFGKGDFTMIATQDRAMDTPDPASLFSIVYTTQAGSNWGRWSDPKVDDLADRALREGNRDKRRQLYWELQRQILGGAPSAIPVAWVEGWFFVDKKLRGYVPARSVYDNNTFMKVWLKE